MIITKGVTRFKFCDPAILVRLSNKTLQGIASPDFFFKAPMCTETFIKRGQIGLRPGVTLQNIGDFLPVTPDEARDKLGITDTGLEVSQLREKVQHLREDELALFKKLSNGESGPIDHLIIDKSIAVAIAVKLGDPAKVLNPEIDWMTALTFDLSASSVSVLPVYAQEREEVFSRFLECLNYNRPFLAGFAFRQLWDGVFRTYWGDERLVGSQKDTYREHLKDITARVITRLYPDNEKSSEPNVQKKLQALAGVAVSSDLPPENVFLSTAASFLSRTEPTMTAEFNLAFLGLDELNKPVFGADVLTDVLNTAQYFKNITPTDGAELKKLIDWAGRRYRGTYKQQEFIVLMLTQKFPGHQNFKTRINLVNRLAELMSIPSEELILYLLVAPLIFPGRNELRHSLPTCPMRFGIHGSC